MLPNPKKKERKKEIKKEMKKNAVLELEEKTKQKWNNCTFCTTYCQNVFTSGEKKSWKKGMNFSEHVFYHQMAIFEGWFHWSKRDSWQLIEACSPFNI